MNGKWNYGIIFINKVVTIKILSSVIKKGGVHAIFLMGSGKEMSNNCAPCFSKIDFVELFLVILNLMNITKNKSEATILSCPATREVSCIYQFITNNHA